MPRPIVATIHLPALQHNLAQLRQRAGTARVWGVVKANAYGHGITRVWPALRAADGLACLDLDEAKLLRELGWRGPLLLLEGTFEPRDLELCSTLQLWHVVHHAEQLDWLAAHKTQQPHHVFLKFNSGMNRLGFDAPGLRAAWARLHAMPQVQGVTLMTHFANADRPDGIEAALRVWRLATEGMQAPLCLANSAATLVHAATTAADWVRPGIALYGAAPDAPTHRAADWGLQPAMTLASQLIATQTLAAGAQVGYGGTYTAPKPTTMGVVACGYADGYPRHAPNGTPVLVQGVRCPLIGRVSMDMLAVDLAPVLAQGQPVGVGSEVVLWGRSRSGAELPIDEVAQAAQTIAYELMCALAPRVRVIVEHQEST